MDQRTEYIIQILEKIGTPLMVSIMESSGGEQDSEARAQADAQDMAGLLAKSVQAGIDIGSDMDFGSLGEQSDSLRVALTAVAGPLIASQYKQNGRIPDDNEIKRMTTALQAIMTFSENFAPGPENAERLKNISANGASVDTHQIDVQYIQAFIPVVNAVAAFPFGQPEQKLIVDISSKLVQKSAEIGELVSDNTGDDDKKFIELAILGSLTKIYGICHVSETSRLTAMSDDERAQHPQAPGGGLALDNVWAAFDMRIAMLETLISNIITGEAKTAGDSSVSPVSPAPAVPAATEPPQAGNPMAMFAKKPDAATKEAPPVQPPPVTETAPVTPDDSQAAPDDGGGPMSFFKSKPTDDSDGS